MNDLISRQAAIDAVKKHYRTHDNDLLELIAFDIERLPPAQGKPFNLPEMLNDPPKMVHRSTKDISKRLSRL